MSYRSPGVFNKEVDESLYVQGAATSVSAMVGTAEKGPIGEPTLITNWPQFVATFGGYLTTSWLAYAAKQFFDEGGSVLYVVRTAHYSDVTDASTLAATAATIVAPDASTDDGWTFTATSPGTWANGIKLVIAAVSGGGFTVKVQDSSSNELEAYTVQDTDTTADDYVETAINGVSAYVTVEVNEGTPAVGTVTLTSGDDGITSIADTDYVGDSAAKTGLYALDSVDTIKLVSVPGVETPTVAAGLITYVENRGTAFAVLGTPTSLDPSEANDYRSGTGAYNHTAFNTSYAALYWPWVRQNDPLTNTTIEVPVEGHMMGLFARSDTESEVWFAPAGLNRGVLRNVLGVAYKSTQGERDELYSNQVNPIASFKDGGVVVWGQKTLTPKPSALDRVNVRRLLGYMKESLRDTAKFLLFEPNDKRTWEAFKRFSVPFLTTIQQGRGLYDFLVVCDETTNTPAVIDANQMVAKIFIKPTKAVEFLEINYIVTGSGANFEEV